MGKNLVLISVGIGKATAGKFSPFCKRGISEGSVLIKNPLQNGVLKKHTT